MSLKLAALFVMGVWAGVLKVSFGCCKSHFSGSEKRRLFHVAGFCRIIQG